MPALSDWIEAVLEEDKQPDDADKPVQSQTRAQLALMMTDEDWKTLARVAAAAVANIVAASVRKASREEPQDMVAA